MLLHCVKLCTRCVARLATKKTQKSEELLHPCDVVATDPKKLTTGIVRPRDTEDLEATDASARALTSALCGALPSMPTLKVDERPWLSLSVPVLDVDDEP